MRDILVPVSVGELIDKITILRIKQRKIGDEAKRRNVETELRALTAVCEQHRIDLASADVRELERINDVLWVIEDDIRDKERAQAFDAEFVRLARAVYVENDERAAIKRRINVKLGSNIVEEKSYASYKL